MMDRLMPWRRAMRAEHSAMNPNPRPPSEPPAQSSQIVHNPDTLIEGRYKMGSIIPWKSRQPATYGTHTHRAGIIAGLVLIALAVVSFLLGWSGILTIVAAGLGVLYFFFGAFGR